MHPGRGRSSSFRAKPRRELVKFTGRTVATLVETVPFLTSAHLRTWWRSTDFTVRAVAPVLILTMCLASPAWADCDFVESTGWNEVEVATSSLSIAYELSADATVTEGRHCTRFNLWGVEHYIHYDFNGGDPAVAFYSGDLTANAVWISIDEWDQMDEVVDSWLDDLSEAGIRSLTPTGETGTMPSPFGSLEYALYNNTTMTCVFVMNTDRRDDTDKVYDGYFCSSNSEDISVEIFPGFIGTKKWRPDGSLLVDAVAAVDSSPAELSMGEELEKLEELKRLHDAGLITDTEYSELRKRALGIE